MRKRNCLIVEDDWMAIEMMTNYIGRSVNLELVGVVQELSDIPAAIQSLNPDIVFLDLIIPIGGPTDFHFGLFPAHVRVVVVSATPSNRFQGIVPRQIAFELLKPVSFEQFEQCTQRL